MWNFSSPASTYPERTTNDRCVVDETTPAQIAAGLRDGSQVRREQRDFEGAPGRPLMRQLR
jgi:hypothetical protein